MSGRKKASPDVTFDAEAVIARDRALGVTDDSVTA